MDRWAGLLVKKLAAVLFYEIVGRSEHSTQDPRPLTTIAEVRELIDDLAAQEVNVRDVNFELSLPAGALDASALPELQRQLNDEFTPMRTRKFHVSLRSPDDPREGTILVSIRPGIPIVVFWLILGAVFFTLRMGFINFRAFKHAILVTMGRYDDPNAPGEVNHFQALSAALSATVGLGNIAGVAIAVMLGGPGATFWLIVAGLLGMTSKFTECTLGLMYREVRPDGRIMGGAMFYLSKGLRELKLGPLGSFLAVLFAVLCVLASFGGGNAFQVSQSLNAVQEQIPFLADHRWVYGAVMAFLTGIVIIGGIQRIAATAEKIVPLMCGVYVLACLWILLINAAEIPAAFREIFAGAFTPRAGYGGLIGVMVMGFRRAAFSNEAGVGSAAIAHSAARTDYPVREGIVALLEPFIDTVIVCTMTALVIVITGAWNAPEYAHFIEADNGAGLTSVAMGEQIGWFPYVLSFSVFLFAYSTMISWSYYGERCWAYLFGDRTSIAYKLLFLLFVFLGSIVSSTNVLELSDLMILAMAFPNILGALLLSNKVKAQLDDYWSRYKSGELKMYK
jgi:AGCS family alanine or glycine:cation symporter